MMKKNKILRYISAIFVSCMINFTEVQASICNDTKSLHAIEQLESAKLLTNAPTFKHGWENGTITLQFTENTSKLVAEPSLCSAQMLLTLPQADLDEVKTYFEANPAKKILLDGQGYTIPEKMNHVTYQYSLGTQGIITNNSDNQDLMALHHGIEYVYQLLAQIRVEVKPTAQNSIVWSAEQQKAEFSICSNKYSNTKVNLADACSCRISRLAETIAPKQMELIHFISSQPYSAATGVLTIYQDFSNQINEDCHIYKK